MIPARKPALTGCLPQSYFGHTETSWPFLWSLGGGLEEVGKGSQQTGSKESSRHLLVEGGGSCCIGPFVRATVQAVVV